MHRTRYSIKHGTIIHRTASIHCATVWNVQSEMFMNVQSEMQGWEIGKANFSSVHIQRTDSLILNSALLPCAMASKPLPNCILQSHSNGQSSSQGKGLCKPVVKILEEGENIFLGGTVMLGIIYWCAKWKDKHNKTKSGTHSLPMLYDCCLPVSSRSQCPNILLLAFLSI